MEGGAKNENPPRVVSRRRLLGGFGAVMAGWTLSRLLKHENNKDNSSNFHVEHPQPNQPQIPTKETVNIENPNLKKFTILVMGDRNNMDSVMQEYRENIQNRFGDKNIPETIEPYRIWIKKYAQEFTVNPIIIEGLIGVESQGDPKSTGRYDPEDVGLLNQQPNNVQPFLKPDEHVYRYKTYRRYFADDARFNPELAIRLGAQYLQVATKYYGGRQDLATLSFFIGYGNLDRILKNNMPQSGASFYEWLKSPETQKQIPVTGLSWETEYPLFVLAAAELANKNSPR